MNLLEACQKVVNVRTASGCFACDGADEPCDGCAAVEVLKDTMREYGADSTYPMVGNTDFLRARLGYLAEMRAHTDYTPAQMVEAINLDDEEHALRLFVTYDDSRPPYEEVQVMVNGETFRCECGSNVQSKIGPDMFRCKGCDMLYQGERSGTA